MAFADIIGPILEKRELSGEEVRILAEYLVSDSTPAQIGAVLMGMTLKGVSAAELAGLVTVLRERMVAIPVESDLVIDTCGTGGGSPSFNISTAASIIASAAGAKIAKHGNRAVTSQCGSADVLESIGIPLHGEPIAAAKAIKEFGFAFLLATKFHPALAHVGPARRELGFRTVFNVMGPMLNPARANRQSMGVFSKEWVPIVAEAYALLGAERAVVVYGNGMDEISPIQPSTVAIVQKGMVTLTEWSPMTFGLQPVNPGALLPGDSIEANARILIRSVTDAESERFRVVQPSAASAIWLAGLADSLPEAAKVAYETVASGKSLRKLGELRESAK